MAGALADLQSDPDSPLAASREAAVSLKGSVASFDPHYGLLNISLPGGTLIAPSPPAEIGETRRIRILASDVSLARENPGRSSILNVLPASVVAMKPLDPYETLVVVALGEKRDGARLLSRMSRKSAEELGLAEGLSVFAQVKYAALAAGRDEE
jgi:molybdate transport system ATP-binding protein